MASTLCLLTLGLCNLGSVDQAQQNRPPPQRGGLLGTASNLLGLGSLTGGGGSSQSFFQPQANIQFEVPQKQNYNAGAPQQTACENIFRYVHDGNQWKGVITLYDNEANTEIFVDTHFMLPRGTPKSMLSGTIQLSNSLQTVYSEISNGQPVIFDVFFTSQNPVPKLVSISRNRRELCRGSMEPGGSSLRLNFMLKPPPQSHQHQTQAPIQYNTQPRVQQQTSRPVQYQTQPQIQYQTQPPFNIRTDEVVYQTRAPPTQPQTRPQAVQSDANAECGTTFGSIVQGYVIGGQEAGRGEWPWLTAIYKSANGNLEYICGGSLISNIYTLTAAHCIQNKRQATGLRAQDVLLFFGKHNLILWNENGYEKKGAMYFKVHPQWDPFATQYDSDLALIRMESPVVYTQYIRAVCLWSFQSDVSSVVGKVGNVAGWGKNEFGKLNTDYPKKVNVPIVSESDCLRSNNVFSSITSDKTFCGGGRHDEGPCSGDSGGGLTLKQGNRWYIRGIVSAGIVEGHLCDVNSYAVFTDVAKFMPWINREMSY